MTLLLEKLIVIVILIVVLKSTGLLCVCVPPSLQVWFRKGLSKANGQENTVTGSRWVQMVGNFSLITVGLNEQVSD